MIDITPTHQVALTKRQILHVIPLEVTSNINNIQQDEITDTSSGTTTIHNIHQDENIQNAETEIALSLHEQQLG